MRPRGPDEQVADFRARVVGPIGAALCDRLAAWAHDHADELADCRPSLPEGVQDRPAEVWEPLLAVTEVAGGRWPIRARDACTTLVEDARMSRPVDRGVRLLADLRTVAAKIEGNHLPSTTLVRHLIGIDESPWVEIDGRPFTERRLSDLLRPFKITPTPNKDGMVRGYYRSVFADAWARYLPDLTAQPGKLSDPSEASNDTAPGTPNHRAADGSDSSEASPAEAPSLVRAYLRQHGPADMRSLASAIGVTIAALRPMLDVDTSGPFVAIPQRDAPPLIGLRA